MEFIYVVTLGGNLSGVYLSEIEARSESAAIGGTVQAMTAAEIRSSDSYSIREAAPFAARLIADAA